MKELACELLVGPAVVVDDEVDNENAAIREIVRELEDENFPVIKRRNIPPDEEIRHWQGLSVIVLDWDLLDLGEPEILGVTIPSEVRENPAVNPLRFVRKIMTELYCPVYVVSRLDPDRIWPQIEEGLSEIECRQMRARIMVGSKHQIVGNLLNELGQWISNHSAIYVLKTWERAHEEAKTALFQDFHSTDVDWPRILWNAWEKDAINPNPDITDTILRNIANRMPPHPFDSTVMALGDDLLSMESVRQVLYQAAVLPADRLYDDIIMPGDFFFELKDGQLLPQHIFICLTPACDLVPRSGSLDDVRMYLVRASPVPDTEINDENKVERRIKEDHSLTSALLHHIVSDDVMYVVRFKHWSIKKWADMKELRQGRLLEPYITVLQQRNGLYSQRQGLPSLPEGFYGPRN